ncbi:hypothetical protein J3366_03065 [Tritonibacter mobilis]|uniref:hypothetical protein n=1 Tax=Tritonibacter mobilis TaxID=379347 RepID=UPI003BA8EB1B
MAKNVKDNPEASEIADIVLKIAALIGVSAAIASFGYNFSLCAPNNYWVVFSIPSFLLAFMVLGLALGLTDKTFGNYRDIDFLTGTLLAKAGKLSLYLLGSFMEISLFAVAFYSFRAAGNLPNCLP